MAEQGIKALLLSIIIVIFVRFVNRKNCTTKAVIFWKFIVGRKCFSAKESEKVENGPGSAGKQRFTALNSHAIILTKVSANGKLR